MGSDHETMHDRRGKPSHGQDQKFNVLHFICETAHNLFCYSDSARISRDIDGSCSVIARDAMYRTRFFPVCISAGSSAAALA